MTNPYICDLAALDATQDALAGGKGAQLGELLRIDGIRVPTGFCVTTEAFRRTLLAAPPIAEHLERLARVDPGDGVAIRTLGAGLRGAVAQVALPGDLAAAITGALGRHGADAAYAVRSSATGEDAADASFAGQHDTFLDVRGPEAVLDAVRGCWASLFTERAVAYRLRAGADLRSAAMAVVVQRMVAARASGVLFTADPVSGNRRVVALEAVAGPGAVLVGGRVRPDAYTVRDDAITARTLAGPRAVLSDAEVVALARLGRRIEAHAGRPQDAEWCLDDDGPAIVQSRPITTLFPVPEAEDDAYRVYLSVGHQQMMTDAMAPLGLSMFQMTAKPRMHEAGGRLFVDVTPRLASPATAAQTVAVLGEADPLTGDALQTIVDRGAVAPAPAGETPAAPLAGTVPSPIATDPAIVTDLIARTDASVAAARRAIEGVSGPAVFAAIREDLEELKGVLFDPVSMQAIMAGMQAAGWLDDRLAAWLGERQASATLTRSVDHNVTAQMGLDLLDVADVVRPHSDVVAFLAARAQDGGGLDGLGTLPGGDAARAALEGYLERYGMRCIGEIDITRPRWSEDPSALLPALLADVAHAAPGGAAERFAQGRRAARAKAQDVLARLRALPDGAAKAEETARMIERVRTFTGYREYPKYGLICRYAIYRQALLAEAQRLVDAGVLGELDDGFFLTFDELEEAVRSGAVDDGLIARRRAAFAVHAALTPPRVLTSEGEGLSGTHRRADLPPGALAGLPVSAGTVEGRARVVSDLADADVTPGDILVTAFTDPSWTPLFVAVAGLVTEVGGRMTHGAVIAREYGLPALVGVQDATRRIADGQRIRVHGDDGYVEILS